MHARTHTDMLVHTACTLPNRSLVRNISLVWHNNGDWTRTHPVELHVQSAGVADGLSLCVSPPQRGRTGMTVSATQTCSSWCALLQRQTGGGDKYSRLWQKCTELKRGTDTGNKINKKTSRTKGEIKYKYIFHQLKISWITNVLFKRLHLHLF